MAPPIKTTTAQTEEESAKKLGDVVRGTLERQAQQRASEIGDLARKYQFMGGAGPRPQQPVDTSFLYPRSTTSQDVVVDNRAFEDALKERAIASRVEVPTGLPTGPQVVESPIFKQGVSQTFPGLPADLTKAPVVEAVPGVGKFREASPGQMQGGFEYVGPPGTGGQPTQPQDTVADEAMRQYLALQAGGYRAAPGVSMNEDMRRGLSGQQEAMRGVVSAMEAEQPGQAQERAAVLSEGQRYAQDLARLQEKQQGVFAQRQERMARDEAAMEQARQQFDPSRVLRDIASSPVSSGALSFAAGLVGMLRGSAGDINSNVVLQEVDKAVERDTKAQLEKYQMLKDGIATGTSNFADMVRMGASEREALGLTAAASLENHKRALEFAAQRISGAREKAAVKEAISAIDFQRGKLKLDIDMKNAANWIAMNRARDEQAIKLLELARKGSANPEAIKAYTSLTGNDRFIAARQGLEAVADIRGVQRKIAPERQKAIWDTSIGRLLNEALTEKTAQSADKGDVVLGAMAKFINSKVAGQRFESPEEQQMVNMVQRLINTNLRQMSGGSVTSGEAMRDYLARNLSNYENFSKWMDLEERRAENDLRQYKVAASADPSLKALMDATLLPGEAPIREYRGRAAATQMAAGAAK